MRLRSPAAAAAFAGRTRSRRTGAARGQDRRCRPRPAAAAPRARPGQRTPATPGACRSRNRPASAHPGAPARRRRHRHRSAALSIRPIRARDRSTHRCSNERPMRCRAGRRAHRPLRWCARPLARSRRSHHARAQGAPTWRHRPSPRSRRSRAHGRPSMSGGACPVPHRRATVAPVAGPGLVVAENAFSGGDDSGRPPARQGTPPHAGVHPDRPAYRSQRAPVTVTALSASPTC